MAALALVVGIAGCACLPSLPEPAQLAARESLSLPHRPPLVRAGEHMTWRVRVGPFAGGWLRMSEVGRERADGRVVAVVSARFATAGLAALLDDRSSDDTTWIDLATARPTRYRSEMAGAGERSSLEARFDRHSVHMVERQPDAQRRVRQRVPGHDGALNLYAALLALRAWPGQATTSATLSVWARSRLWRTTVRRAGRETVAIAGAPRRAYRIDGVAWRTRRDGSADADTAPRRFRLYISADRDRLPLLLETDSRWGRVRAELVSHRKAPAARAGIR